MNFIKNNGAGLLLCLAIAVPSWLLGQAVPVIGGPVFAILIGMIVTLALTKKEPFTAGINYTSKKILQAAVVFLGFGMNLTEILAKGKQSLPIIISTIAASLIIAYILFKALKLRTNNAILVGVGSSICGGSAIAATAPVIKASDEEVAQSISVIFLFNVLAALIFPTLGGALGLSNEGFRPLCRHRCQRYLFRHRRRFCLGWYASRCQYAGHRCHRKDDPDAGHHPHHAGAGAAAHSAGREAGRCPGEHQEDLPLVRAAVFGGVHHHHAAAHPRRLGELPEKRQQVLHRHGHGGHRPEHRHRASREVGRQAISWASAAGWPSPPSAWECSTSWDCGSGHR